MVGGVLNFFHILLHFQSFGLTIVFVFISSVCEWSILGIECVVSEVVLKIFICVRKKYSFVDMLQMFLSPDDGAAVLHVSASNFVSYLHVSLGVTHQCNCASCVSVRLCYRCSCIDVLQMLTYWSVVDGGWVSANLCTGAALCPGTL